MWSRLVFVSCLLLTAHGLGGRQNLGGGSRSMMPGGRVDATGTVSPDDEAVRFAVGAVNSWFAAKDSTSASRTLVRIVKAESQIVAGVKLYLTLQLSTGEPQAKDDVCDIEVVFKPWMNGTERLQVVKEPVCTQTPPSTDTAFASRPLLGGQKPVSGSLSQEAQTALNFAVGEVNRRSNSLYLFSLNNRDLDNINATEQVVAGTMFRFFGVPLYQTGCTKMDSLRVSTSTDCAAVDGGERMICDLEVWWQAWSSPQYKLQRHSCKKDPASQQ